MKSDYFVIAEVARRRFAMAGSAGIVAMLVLVGLAGGTGWGQPLRHGAQGATGSEESGRSQVVASDIPVDDLNRGTPRRAVHGFLQATRAHDYQRAADYLDLRHVPASEVGTLGPKLARQLKIVLDQTLALDVDALIDTP